MSISSFGALVVVSPDRARKQIVDAYTKAKGNKIATARALGVTHRSLYRHIATLDLFAALDAISKDRGFEVRSGPARAPHD